MTITFGPVPHFDTLSPIEAETVLYNQLVPACEEKGILLSQYGNHNGLGSLRSPDQYHTQKTERSLFDVQRVQKAFAFVSTSYIPPRQYKLNSYGLKHVVERAQGEYLTNGDLTAAMLISGFKARYALPRQPLVNLQFRAKAI